MVIELKQQGRAGTEEQVPIVTTPTKVQQAGNQAEESARLQEGMTTIVQGQMHEVLPSNHIDA